ncbi:Ribokinase-like protein [Xylariaceae sp. FL1272]|nr:Ribokinase-like protein [Xylariaceae sp. FL1272]
MGQCLTKKPPDSSPIFVSLGMVVLDELRFTHRDPLFDVLGGSGLYATLGARIFKPANQSTEVGCIVIVGHDFPEPITRLLRSWKTRLLIEPYPDRPSTRGLLQYEDDIYSKKSFAYTTAPLRPSPTHLADSILLGARSFHFLAEPTDLEPDITELLRLRRGKGIVEQPLLVWEPAPLGCDSVNLASHLQACKLVDVFSPNHLELGYLVEGKCESEPVFSREVIETQARIFLDSGIGRDGDGLVVIRSGEHGVYYLSKSRAEWLPPYYDPECDKVVDPTGAGNAFLGAFTVSFQETRDSRQACIHGSIAASFAIEQFGPPKLTVTSCAFGERWNGSDVISRVHEYKSRVPDT